MWDTFIVSPMTNLLLLIYNLIGQNFGIAIVLFTILIRAITYSSNQEFGKPAGTRMRHGGGDNVT